MKNFLLIVFLFCSFYVSNANSLLDKTQVLNVEEKLIKLPISLSFSGSATVFGQTCNFTVDAVIIWDTETGLIHLESMSVSYTGGLCGTGSYEVGGRGTVDKGGEATFNVLIASGGNQDFIDSPDFIRQLEAAATRAIQKYH